MEEERTVIGVLREGLLGRRATAFGARVSPPPVLVVAVVGQRLVLRGGARTVVGRHAAVGPRAGTRAALLLRDELLRHALLHITSKHSHYTYSICF